MQAYKLIKPNIYIYIYLIFFFIRFFHFLQGRKNVLTFLSSPQPPLMIIIMISEGGGGAGLRERGSFVRCPRMTRTSSKRSPSPLPPLTGEIYIFIRFIYFIYKTMMEGLQGGGGGIGINEIYPFEWVLQKTK